MRSTAKTVDQYLEGLPDDRREALQSVRHVILKNLGKGFEETIQYGMIGYVVPHSVYPAGYHCDPRQPLPFAGLASQKNYMSLYLMCVYGNPAEEKWFREAWSKSGKKLDMGKSCVRFRKIEDVPLRVIGQAVKRISAPAFIGHYEAALSGARSAPRRKTKKKVAKRTPRKPAATRASTPAARKKKKKKNTKTPKAKKAAKRTTRKKRPARRK